MAQEACFDSNRELAMPCVVPNDGNGGLESSSSNISPRDEAYASPVALPFSIVKMAELNANFASDDVYSAMLEKFTNPGSGVAINSLVADANSMLSSRAFLQRSGNTGMDYLNIPSSPKSFLSDNLNNLAMDVSQACQQNSVEDQNCQPGHKRPQAPNIGGSVLLTKLQNHPFLLATGIKQDSNSLIQMLKKPKIDANNDVTEEQIVQQLLLRQDIKQLQDHHPQLRALVQQQIFDSLPRFHGVQAQQSERQFRHQLQQQATSPASSRDDGVCFQQLIQCLYSLKNQPQDNSIDFWRRIVSDFYAPCAKERWCFSSYQNIGQHALGILSLGAVGAWCCDLCSSGSGKGFEASFEVLPRLWKIKFESGVLEEILFLAFPQQRRLPSGMMLLEYGKAVQQSVYEQFRVVHEGKLRVIFRHDLKILSWEFCASHHDEYFLRRFIAPQVNQLMCAAQQYQVMLTECTPEDKLPVERLQASCNMFAKAGNQFTRSLELPTVNELGFSKRYIRCMQIAEVLNIMKDLITFSLNHKVGPIESMRTYHHKGIIKETTGRSIKTGEEQEKSGEGSIQNVLTNENRSAGRNIGLHGNNSTTNDRVVCNSRAGDMEVLLASYYQKILRESLVNPRATLLKPDQSYLMETASLRAISSSFLGQQFPNPGLFHSTGLSNPQSSEASKNTEQHMIDKLLRNALGKQKEQAFCEINENILSGLPTRTRGTNIFSNGPALGNSTTTALRQENLCGNVRGNAESFKGSSKSDFLQVADSSPRIIRGTDTIDFHLPEAFRGTYGHVSRNDV